MNSSRPVLRYESALFGYAGSIKLPLVPPIELTPASFPSNLEIWEEKQRNSMKANIGAPYGVYSSSFCPINHKGPPPSLSQTKGGATPKSQAYNGGLGHSRSSPALTTVAKEMTRIRNMR